MASTPMVLLCCACACGSGMVARPHVEKAVKSITRTHQAPRKAPSNVKQSAASLPCAPAIAGASGVPMDIIAPLEATSMSIPTFVVENPNQGWGWPVYIEDDDDGWFGPGRPGGGGGAVPEPSSWAMMITGFGLVGFSQRQSKKKAVNDDQ